MPAPSPILPDRSRRDWTAEQLHALPDDGNRYEVVDGELLVTPAPSWRHQGAVGELYVLLREYAHRHALHCMIAPAEVPFSRTTVVEPDVFVTPRRADGAPPREFSDVRRLVLAVEVLSPTSLRADRHVKRRLYQREGVEEYWIVDTEHRVIERWCPGTEIPDVLAESLAWSPMPDEEPLVIDLVAYFRRVHGEETAAN
ncbi:MAG: Uma2 family endonuclease [Gemmatimonadaceae bacterium]|nr:Uma2 family endonuclease [Gemmatimonadaceae bacterium]